MALSDMLWWICTLAVLAAGAEHEMPQNSSAFKNATCQTLTAIKEEAECGDAQPWDIQRVSSLLLSARKLVAALHQQQLQDCRGADPRECPDAEVPENGGLACVTVANRRYCKPLCNHGYDFGFIRVSRLYDECSEQTGHMWRTQYVGGNKLAVCNKERVQAAGARSAYFPEGRNCLATKSSSQERSRIVQEFIAELKGRGVEGEPQQACLVCG